jgi:uncharacterized membrane protein YtjA (UPF0391 family)
LRIAGRPELDRTAALLGTVRRAGAAIALRFIEILLTSGDVPVMQHACHFKEPNPSSATSQHVGIKSPGSPLADGVARPATDDDARGQRRVEAEIACSHNASRDADQGRPDGGTKARPKWVGQCAAGPSAQRSALSPAINHVASTSHDVVRVSLAPRPSASGTQFSNMQVARPRRRRTDLLDSWVHAFLPFVADSQPSERSGAHPHSGQGITARPAWFLSSSPIAAHSLRCVRPGAATYQVPLSSRLSYEKEKIMLGWAITFLIIALIAAIMGFGVVAGTAAAVAKVIFAVFIILFLISLATGQRTPVP